MRNIAILTEYEGTDLHGWQSQKGLPNVQDEIIKAVFSLTGEKIKLNGCSRTDSGVHATGHVSNFHTDSSIPTEKFPLAINSRLPPDISIINAAEVPPEFHARFDAIGKRYRYKMIYGLARPALERARVFHLTGHPDISSIIEAASMLEGSHDFKGFMATGSSVKSTIRTIYSVSVEHQAPHIDLVFHGDGFLYNMVRIMAGTLYYVGKGKLNESDIADILQSGDRRKAGKTLPAKGLYLEKVFYENDIFGDNTNIELK